MNRSEIVDQIRFLSLIEEREVSNSDLELLIDEGYGVVEGTKVWPWAIVSKPALIKTTAGAEKYVIPSFSHIISIVSRDGTRQLRSVSPQELATNAWEHYGEPKVFCVQDKKVVLSPIPHSSCQNFDVIYTRLKNWPCDEDSPPFEPQFHSILTDWALHRLWEREEDFDRSDRYRARFQARLNEMIGFYNSRSEDRPLIFGEGPRPPHSLFPNYDANPMIKEMT